MLKQHRYHDIYLADGLKKNFISEDTTFTKSYGLSMSVKMLNKSQVSNDAVRFQSMLNHIEGDGYIFTDSDDITFQSIDLFYLRSKINNHISVGVDAGMFSISQHEKKYNGIRYGTSLVYDNFSLRLGMNSYDDFSEFVPTLKYTNVYKEHSYVLEYTRQNALFYTYSLIPYEKKIVANHFSATDYIVFNNKTNLWANLEVNLFSNNDTEVTGQFDWVFYKNTYWTPKFTYTLALEGWYTSHSLQHDDFYSPSFADATMIRFNPQYIFSKYLGVHGQIGTGYSVVDQTIPYKYGLWLFGNPINNLNYEIGCLKSNAARLSYGGDYHYQECKATLGYSW